ncbi:hypothetical protein WN51_01250 [Melipona quadrifasciata]|uniref:Uncharacterized protein n=1 Tax=Melipona quadrifasciata TaxID=166423 RepID=A0A0M8ZWS0_9HYME|nr:hypothetical protein WN51_01250 [Melipona quadrifasciata]
MEAADESTERFRRRADFREISNLKQHETQTCSSCTQTADNLNSDEIFPRNFSAEFSAVIILQNKTQQRREAGSQTFAPSSSRANED